MSQYEVYRKNILINIFLMPSLVCGTCDERGDKCKGTAQTQANWKKTCKEDSVA